MRRRSRIVALFAAAALLLAQMAASAYACPGMGDGDAAMAKAAEEGVTMDNANLCERHCNGGKVSFETVKPASPAPVALASPMRIAVVEALALHAPPPASPCFSAGPAPPLVRSVVLRI